MYGYPMFLHQADDSINVQKDWMKDYKFHLVSSIDQLSKLVDICIQKKLYSIDLETTGVDNRVYDDEYFEDGVKTRHGMRTVDKVVGVCISFDGLNGYYIPFGHYPEDSGNLPWNDGWDQIERLVKSGSKAILHNSKFDLEFLYPLTGKDLWKLSEFEDTLLISKIISPLKSNPNGLKQLTKIHFGVEMIELDDLFTPEMKDQLRRDKQSYNFANLHPKEGTAYGCSDGIFTYKLFSVLQSKFSGNDQNIYELEKSFCNVLRKLERNRVHIDVPRLIELEKLCKEASKEVSDTVKDIIEKGTGRTGRWLTLNVGSPSQLSVAMFTDPEGLKLKPILEMISNENGDSSDSDDDDDTSESETEKKQYSLKDEILKSLHKVYGDKFMVERNHNGETKKESIFELILEYRHYEKMLGSYVGPLTLAVDRNGDVRPNFNQMGTDTARLSSRAGKIEQGYSGINFQGIPRDSDEDKPELFKQIRTVITPREGFMLAKLDFAGEELRVVTNLSGDPIWTDSFLNKDGDVHSITARTLFGKKDVNKDERNRGKRCNFAFIYGGGAGAIQRNIGCSIEDAQRHMENLKNDVPVLMGYVDHQKLFARKNKCIYTSFGRRIPIMNIDSPIRALRSKAERCAINYTIQGTSADILKFAMCFVDKKIREKKWENDVRYVLTVHDEVVFEIRPHLLMEAVRLLDEWMTRPWQLEKAHGRDWVVPLLTEPGIDYNWKARYNYFEMVDGMPANPKDIDSDGKYTGKLKKGQYFFEGRIYQEVPDFLKQWISGPQKSSIDVDTRVEADSASVDTTVEEDSAKETKTESQIHDIDISLNKKTIDNENKLKEIMDRLGAGINDETLSNDAESYIGFDDSGLFQDNKNSEAPKEEKVSIPTKTILSPKPPSDDFSDFDVEINEVYDPEKKKMVSVHKPDTIPPQKEEKTITKEPEPVFRWVIRCPLTSYNAKKFNAVCLLAQGETLLRVVLPNNEIMISEEESVRVDKEMFTALTKLFGLG